MVITDDHELSSSLKTLKEMHIAGTRPYRTDNYRDVVFPGSQVRIRGIDVHARLRIDSRSRVAPWFHRIRRVHGVPHPAVQHKINYGSTIESTDEIHGDGIP